MSQIDALPTSLAPVGVPSAELSSSSSTSSMFVTAGAFSPQLTIVGAFNLTNGSSSAIFNCTTWTAFLSAFAFFESVRLDRVHFKLGLSAGIGALIQFGVYPVGSKPANISGCPVYDFLGGGSIGMAETMFSFSAQSRFGREVKARYLGTPPPVFWFDASALGEAQSVVLHYTFDVTVAGNAPPVNIASLSVTSVARDHFIPDSTTQITDNGNIANEED